MNKLMNVATPEKDRVGPSFWRARIPGGWLVITEDTDDRYSSSFVPDPEHTWEGESQIDPGHDWSELK